MEMTVTNDYYWNILKDLSDDRKIDLINRLVKSLVHREETMRKHITISPEQISNVWSEDGLTAEEEISQIREARIQGLTRKIIDL